jgi:hypothetical protein
MISDFRKEFLYTSKLIYYHQEPLSEFLHQVANVALKFQVPLLVDLGIVSQHLYIDLPIFICLQL